MSSNTSARWAEICSKLAGDIERYMHRNTVDDQSGLSFITHDDLVLLWKSPLGSNGYSAFQFFESHLLNCSSESFCDRLIRVTSILIYIEWDGWRHFAPSFGTDGGSFNDNDLPFTAEKLRQLQLGRHGVKFRDAQYCFIPIVIDEGREFRSRDQFMRLPFISEQSLNQKGQYGDVTKVEIAPKHFFNSDGTSNRDPKVVARKHIKVDQENYDYEVRNLNILRKSDISHNRIMMHLGSVKVGEQCNILFPWADIDLETLLKFKTLPDWMSESDVSPKVLLREAFGIADALGFLHEELKQRRSPIQLCHMDLKPNNILVVRDREHPLGKWKITDFGISNVEARSMDRTIGELVTRAAMSSTRESSFYSMRKPGPFQPPEAEVEVARTIPQARQSMSGPKSDMWSFGCILLIVLVFAVGGAPLVMVLEDKRYENEFDDDGCSRQGYFYRKISGLFQINPGIVEWLECLSRDRRWSWFSNTWRLITNSSLTVDLNSRATAKEISGRLETISIEAPGNNIWLRTRDPPHRSPTHNTRRPEHRDSLPRRPLPVDTSVSLTSNPTRRGNVRDPWPSRGHNVEGLPPTSEDNDISAAELSSRSPPSTRGSRIIPERWSSHRHSSPISGSHSRHSSSSGRIVHPGVCDLSIDLHKEKGVQLGSDGERVAFWNESRTKVFRAGRADSHSLFSRNRVKNLPDEGMIHWGDVRLSGPFIALRKHKDNKIVSVDLDRRVIPYEKDWSSCIDCATVFRFDVSSTGSMAFISERSIVAFRNDDTIQLDFQCPRNIEGFFTAVAFHRNGDMLLAVLTSHWFLWQMDQNSRYSLYRSGPHRLAKKDHGGFNPSLVSFVHLPIFILKDQTQSGKLMLVPPGDNANFDISKDALAITITPDDRNLVFVTVERHHWGLKYLLKTRRISQEPSGEISVSNEVKEYKLDLHCNLTRSFANHPKVSLVAIEEDGSQFGLVALSSGHVQRIQLQGAT